MSLWHVVSLNLFGCKYIYATSQPQVNRGIEVALPVRS